MRHLRAYACRNIFKKEFDGGLAMKGFWIKLGSIALVLMMSMTFIGCGNNGGGGGRARVNDGTWTVRTYGWSIQEPIITDVTFHANHLIRIRVRHHDETIRLFERVEQQFIPAIIREQSIGVDTIAGATLTAEAIRHAAWQAIELAGGVPEQWHISPRTVNRTMILPNDGGEPFDVVVMGLGTAGVNAFMRAADMGVTVFGIEMNAGIGSNGTLSGGMQVINSKTVARRFNLPPVASDWSSGYSGTRADWIERYRTVQAPGAFWINHGHPAEEVNSWLRNDLPASVMPNVWRGRPGREGGARLPNLDAFVYVSGPHFDWLQSWEQRRLLHGQSPVASWTGHVRYGLNIAEIGPWANFQRWVGRSDVPPRPDIGATPDGPTTVRFGSDTFRWGSETNADGTIIRYQFHDDYYAGNTHLPRVYQNWMNMAQALHPRNDFMFNLRATGLSQVEIDGEEIFRIPARHRNGTRFYIYGRNVVLATGGFFGNRDMMEHFHPGKYPRTAGMLTSATGDGIIFGQDLGAATYNIGMSGLTTGFIRMRNRTTTWVDNQLVDSAAINGTWMANWTTLVMRPLNLIVAQQQPWTTRTAQGPDFFRTDHRGRRWHNAHGITVNQHAGATWAVIYYHEEIYGFQTQNLGAVSSQMQPGRPPGIAYQANQPWPDIIHMIPWALRTGQVVRADTLEELAHLLGFHNNVYLPTRDIPSDTPVNLSLQRRFLDEVDNWNEFLTRSADPGITGPSTWEVGLTETLGFDRRFPNRARQGQTPPAHGRVPQVIPTGPESDAARDARRAAGRGRYYAVLGSAHWYTNIGGLDANERAEILTIDEAPIPGLFGGGDVTMGTVHSRFGNYTMGVRTALAQGWGWTSGFIAGDSAARRALYARNANNHRGNPIQERAEWPHSVFEDSRLELVSW